MADLLNFDIGNLLDLGPDELVGNSADQSDTAPPEDQAADTGPAGLQSPATLISSNAIDAIPKQNADAGLDLPGNLNNGLALTASAPPAAPTTTGSLQTLADYLRVGFWADFRSFTPHQYNLTSTGTFANSGTLYYNVTGFSSSLTTDYGTEGNDANGITSARQVLVREAFKVYSAVLGINFVETTSTDTSIVDFFFKDNVAGQAYEAERTSTGTGGNVKYAVINVSAGWSGGTSNIGGTNGYTFQTFLHEIGHALGLGHQGLYNAGSGAPTYDNSAQWQNDSWTQTMMSYWDQSANTWLSTDSLAQLVTPMAVDWIALNDIYSGQGYSTANAFGGDTIYGMGTTITATVSKAFANLATYAATNAFTIVDGSGIDTVDFSNYNDDQVINLGLSSTSGVQATKSSVGGKVDNMTIAVGTVIENATTGGGNDTLNGNDYDNVLTGNAGKDTINGLGGNDLLKGGAGNDTLDGGTGTDTADYSEKTDAVAVTLNSSTAVNVTIGTETDSIVNIENINGGSGNDTITGDANANTLNGNGGNDTLKGGDGVDTLNGGDGNDIIEGGFWVDTVNGGVGDDRFVVGGQDFGDTTDGGDGIDTLDASGRTDGFGVVVNLGTGSYSIYDGYTSFGPYSIVNVENVEGTAYADTITGSALGNTLNGNGGNDTLKGGDGVDTLNGGDGNDIIEGGFWVDTVNGGAGDDRFVVGGQDLGDTTDGGDGIDTLDASGRTDAFGVVVNLATSSYSLFDGFSSYGPYSIVNVENVYGSGNADTLTGDGNANTLKGNGGIDTINGGDGDDIIEGGAQVDIVNGGVGNDRFVVGGQDLGDTTDGGDGIDTLDVSGRTDGYGAVVNLGTHNYYLFNGVLSFGPYSIVNVENVEGSSYADTLAGDTNDNTLKGNGGNDSIFGGAGNDTLDGGAGSDTADFSDKTDALVIALNGATPVHVTAGSETDSIVNFESINGGSGDDTLTGDGNNNTLNGNGGNDILVGGNGSDTLNGGAGDDTITDTSFDSASNIVNGGAGNDHLINLYTNVGGTWDGGADTDTIDFSFDTFTGNFDLSLASFVVYSTTFKNFENVTGTQGDDTIKGSAGANVLDGQDGNDTISGGDGIDTIYGGNGDDTIAGGLQVDIVNGGAGNDTFVLAGVDLGDTIDGGADIDTLDLTGYDVAFTLNVNLLTGVYSRQNVFLDTFSITGVENVNGGDNGDTLTGDGNANALNGNGGDDFITGGEGDDTLDGGAGSDTADYSDKTGAITVALNGATPVDVVVGTETDSIANFENINGGSGGDTITGDGNSNTLNGSDGDDTIDGGWGNDTLNGGAGDDTLTDSSLDGSANNVNGGAGNDHLINKYTDHGGTWDGGADTDTIDFSFDDFAGNFNLSLGSFVVYLTTFLNFENLVGTQGADIITGSIGANVLEGQGGDDVIKGGNGADSLFGGAGNDVLQGGGGIDSFTGGAGDDRFYVDDAAETVNELGGDGYDTVITSKSYALAAGQEIEDLRTNYQAGTAAIALTGNEFANSLTGNAGDNRLDGGAGIDQMRGRGGNDTYVVDDAADFVGEKAGGGNDTVLASVSYTLKSTIEVENLRTTNDSGVDAINLTGNEFANTITGNAANNILKGGLGADTMQGLGGNDTYVIDNAGDIVTELASGGTDTVLTGVSYALAAGSEIEVLRTTSAGAVTALDLTGNEFANSIIGNAGNNTLNGKGGLDTLTGGNGQDSFVFDTALGASNIDTITSFVTADDTIVLDSAIFTAFSSLGTLAAGAFNTGAAATEADDRIIFNAAAKALLYDADGLGGAAAIQFATISNVGGALSASDFLVI